MRFDEKSVLVTGGGSGIGRGVVLALAREGARLTIVDQDSAAGEETCHEIARAGGRAIYVKADVRSFDACAKAVATTVAEYGRLDGAFNNAGGQGAFHAIDETPMEVADYWIDTNLKGVFYCVSAEFAAKRRTGGGAIVNTASIFAHKAIPNLAYYVAAKHGVAGLTKAAALDGASLKIRVNAVSPGPVKTPSLDRASGGNDEIFTTLVPIGRVGQPADIANAVLWLLGEESDYVTGAVLSVDGGMAAG